MKILAEVKIGTCFIRIMTPGDNGEPFDLREFVIDTTYLGMTVNPQTISGYSLKCALSAWRSILEQMEGVKV
jgi:hypothetical protein